MSLKIPVIREPGFDHAPWFNGIIHGASIEARRRGVLCRVRECAADELPGLKFDDIEVPIRPVILVGSSVEWLSNVKRLCADVSLRPILAGNCTDEGIFFPISTVSINRSHAIMRLTGELYDSGRRNFALVGSLPESVTDIHRRELFASVMKSFGLYREDAFYDQTNGLAECLTRFGRNAAKYDVVFFTNDIIALCFAPRAAAMGIVIPRDLVPVGFGNLPLSAAMLPQLISFSLDFVLIGRTSLKTALELARRPEQLSCKIELACGICRGSDVCIPAARADASEMAYDDREYGALCYIDRLFSAGDRLSLDILHGINEGLTYSNIADGLFLSESALRYRIRNIFSGLGAVSRADACRLTGRYLALRMQKL